MNVVFVTGTAGAGKSLLTASLISWYHEKSQNAITVNLDPGVLALPYEPDVDVRTMIDLQELMSKYSLGPNGALVFASDLIASKLPEIQDEIESSNPDFVVVDTPGQIELFAFRESGPFVAKSMRADSKAVLFLIDSLVASTPTSFLSLLLLSTSVQLRMGLPLLQVLSKTDIAQNAKEIVGWSREASKFERSLSETKSGDAYTFYSQIFRAIRKTTILTDVYPVSGYTRDGFIALVGELSRIAKGGEEFEEH
ncbi:MAG: ATP/GTP-binding protein [Nitrososphaerota archaeon]|nr:ATP/GTP-binding protein [Nitrososphaerota archaeon]MDG6967374.1 ATP/GTP-binding protein [Nitrososphaerota archaeon]MDG6978452.1 ATP/GTP-binding protein [Nitrososphaerota archaeon]MDG7006479.1 ATP/GTP-binding protein [Nitrososphaerota archaeon]